MHRLLIALHLACLLLDGPYKVQRGFTVEPAVPEPVQSEPLKAKATVPAAVQSASVPASPVDRRIRILAFLQKYCRPCQRDKARITGRGEHWPEWSVGIGNDKQIQLLDLKADDAWFDKYGVASTPTYILVDGNREISRTNSVDAAVLAYNRHVRPPRPDKQLSPGRWRLSGVPWKADTIREHMLHHFKHGRAHGWTPEKVQGMTAEELVRAHDAQHDSEVKRQPVAP